jgi:G:T/U-mismatch repair DNA glycosylase
LDAIRKEHDIKAVFTTGKASYDVYRKYIGDDNILLPSPSAANAAMSLDKLIEAYRVIVGYIKD